MQYSNRPAKISLTFLSWGLFFLLGACQPQQTPRFVGQNVQLSTDQNSRAQCSDGLPGDLNADASIDLLDIVAMVNIVLGTLETNGCADLNADGVVTLLDIVVLVELILNESELDSSQVQTPNELEQDVWPGNGPACEGECEPNGADDDDNGDDGEEDESDPEPFSCKAKDLACPGEPDGLWQDGNGGQGIGCDWYAGAAWRCGDYADDWPNPNCGLTANEACGVCGGGLSAPDLNVIHMNIGRMAEEMLDVRYKCGTTGEIYDDPWQSYSDCRSDCSGGPYDCTALNPVSFEECGSCIGNGVCTRTREQEIAAYISSKNPDVINFTEAYITDKSCESVSCADHWDNSNSPCYDDTSDPYYGLDQLDRLVGNTKAMYDAGSPLYNIECVEYSCVAVKAPLEFTHGMLQVKTDECLNTDGTYARGNIGYNCVDTSALGDYSNVKVITAHPDRKTTYEADVCRKSVYKAMYEDIPEPGEHVLIFGDMNADPYRYNIGNFIDWTREGKCSNPQFNGDKGGCCTDASQTYGTGSWDGYECTKCYWDGNSYDDCVESNQFSEWTPGAMEYLEGFYKWLANHIRINQVELHEVLDVGSCGDYALHSWNFEHQVSSVDLKITNPSGNEVDITQSNPSEEYYNLETSAYMSFSNRSRACNNGLCPSVPPLTGCSGNDHYFNAIVSGWVGITFRLDKENSAPSIASIDVSDLDLYVDNDFWGDVAQLLQDKISEKFKTKVQAVINGHIGLLQDPDVADKFGEILLVRYNDVVNNGTSSEYAWSTDYWHTQTTPNPSAWTDPGTFVVHNAGQSWADSDCVDQCWASWNYYENTFCSTDQCRSAREFQRGWSHVSYWEGCSGSGCQPDNCLNSCYLPYDLRGSVWPADFYKYGPSGPTAWADAGGLWLRDEGNTQNAYYYYGGPELTHEWLFWTGTIDYIISNFSMEQNCSAQYFNFMDHKAVNCTLGASRSRPLPRESSLPSLTQLEGDGRTIPTLEHKTKMRD